MYQVCTRPRLKSLTVVCNQSTVQRNQISTMARSRKRHLQQELTWRTHGGKREGAGRPPNGPKAGMPHARRPAHTRSHPLHVTIRVASDIGSLRKRDMFLAIREASIVTAMREDFRIVHLSVQGTHLHLLVEADSKSAITRGMRGFQISAARQINAVMTARTGKLRTGAVFPDRYHSRALTSPRAVRHALAYVLNNWRRHREDRDDRARTWAVDPFSSGVMFPGWREREGMPTLFRPPRTYLGVVTWLPRTWLLRTGWTRHGLVSTHEVPGPEHARR